MKVEIETGGCTLRIGDSALITVSEIGVHPVITVDMYYCNEGRGTNAERDGRPAIILYDQAHDEPRVAVRHQPDGTLTVEIAEDVPLKVAEM